MEILKNWRSRRPTEQTFVDQFENNRTSLSTYSRSSLQLSSLQDCYEEKSQTELKKMILEFGTVDIEEELIDKMLLLALECAYVLNI